jgi:hypothetical protein
MHSTDGQVSIYALDDLFGGNSQVNLQALAAVPELPVWLTPVGRAYRVTVEGALGNQAILFSYLGREVPGGQEENLRIYYLPEGQQSWQRLATELDARDNHASATMPGAGTYALMATIEIPPFTPGWNNFGYPVPGSRPVGEALASVAGAYTSIYAFDPGAASQWQLYDRTVPSAFAGLVNDLTELQFGRGYWLYATRAITLYLGVADDPALAANGPVTTQEVQMPPATYYGWVTGSEGFTPSASMEVTAWINNTQCGQTTIVPWSGKLAYKLQVAAENLTGLPNGCGASGRQLVIKIEGRTMAADRTWDNSQAWHLSLGGNAYQLYLPLVASKSTAAMTAGEIAPPAPGIHFRQANQSPSRSAMTALTRSASAGKRTGGLAYWLSTSSNVPAW